MDDDLVILMGQDVGDFLRHRSEPRRLTKKSSLAPAPPGMRLPSYDRCPRLAAFVTIVLWAIRGRPHPWPRRVKVPSLVKHNRFVRLGLPDGY